MHVNIDRPYNTKEEFNYKLWEKIKRTIGPAEICYKLHLNPLYVFLISLMGLLIGLTLILNYISIPIIIAFPIRDISLLLFLLGFLLFFHRDPERKIINRDNAILSPADGVIVYIKELKRGEIPISVKGKNKISLNQLTKCSDFLEKDGYLIGIGMKLFDVHINRSPISGNVKVSKHNPGKFISMTNSDFEIANESETTIIEHSKGYVIGVIQIATFLVRGIESFLHEGDLIAQGDRIGRIKLGSQVDLVIPFSDIDIVVDIGQRVYAGESILAVVK